MRYVLDFGSANAGGAPSFVSYKRLDTLADLTPPAISEAGAGLYYFDVDWATAPATSITFKATLAGSELSDVINAPVSTLTGSSVVVGGDFLASVRRRARIPSAVALGSSDGDLLALANEEMDSYLVPFVHKRREDYWLTHQDLAVAAGAHYRIPYRAIGNKLREVSFLDGQGRVEDGPRIPVDALEGKDVGFYVEGGELVFAGTQHALPASLRLWYCIRPGRLVGTADAGVVASLDRNARTVTLAAVPSGFTGATSFDFIRAKPGYETLAFDAAGTLSVATITFAAELPAELAVGDYVTLPEQSPVVQAPPDLHPLLAQRVACKWIEANDPEALKNALGILKEMEDNAHTLLTPRVEGAPQAIINANPLWG